MKRIDYNKTANYYVSKRYGYSHHSSGILSKYFNKTQGSSTSMDVNKRPGFNRWYGNKANTILLIEDNQSTTFIDSLLNPKFRKQFNNGQMQHLGYLNQPIKGGFAKAEDIKEDDVIYFTKSSKYPRYKLREFTNNKKTIKEERANYIVIPDPVLTGISKHPVWYIPEKDLYVLQQHTGYGYQFKTGEFKKMVATEEEVDVNTFVDMHVYNLNINIVPDATKGADIFSLMMSDRSIFLPESELEKYVSKYTKEMTDEEFEMIDKYLKSTDTNIVSVGIRMLNNYDTESSFIPMALLLMNNCQNMTRSNDWNSTGFNVIKDKIGAKVNYQYATNPQSYIRTLDQLYQVKPEERVKELGKKAVESFIKNFIDSQVTGCSFITNIDVVVS